MNDKEGQGRLVVWRSGLGVKMEVGVEAGTGQPVRMEKLLDLSLK